MKRTTHTRKIQNGTATRSASMGDSGVQHRSRRGVRAVGFWVLVIVAGVASIALMTGPNPAHGPAVWVAWFLVFGVVLRLLWRILRELLSAALLVILILALFGLF